MPSALSVVAIGTLLLYLAYLYIIHNDQALTALPPEGEDISPRRFTAEEIQSTFNRLREDPITIEDKLPPKTGRRYIVVGGVSTSHDLSRTAQCIKLRQAFSEDGSSCISSNEAKTLSEFVSSISAPLRAKILPQARLPTSTFG